MSHLSYISENREHDDILNRYWNQFDSQERGVYSLLSSLVVLILLIIIIIYFRLKT